MYVCLARRRIYNPEYVSEFLKVFLLFMIIVRFKKEVFRKADKKLLEL